MIPSALYCQNWVYFAIKRLAVNSFQLWLVSGHDCRRQLEGMGAIASMTIAQMATKWLEGTIASVVAFLSGKAASRSSDEIKGAAVYLGKSGMSAPRASPGAEKAEEFCKVMPFEGDMAYIMVRQCALHQLTAAPAWAGLSKSAPAGNSGPSVKILRAQHRCLFPMLAS